MICHVTRIHLMKNYQYYIISSPYYGSPLFDEKSKHKVPKIIFKSHHFIIGGKMRGIDLIENSKQINEILEMSP